MFKDNDKRMFGVSKMTKLEIRFFRLFYLRKIIHFFYFKTILFYKLKYRKAGLKIWIFGKKMKIL